MSKTNPTLHEEHYSTISNFNENGYEHALIELFEKMGYTSICGFDYDTRDYSSPLLDSVVEDSIVKINKDCPLEAIQAAISKVNYFDIGSLIDKNSLFLDYLQNGIEVDYYSSEEGKNCTTIVYLVDYKNVSNNSFIVANQWTYEEHSKRRPDIILFLNGFPVVLIEIKSPSRIDTDASEGYTQIRNYLKEIPSMFIYNCVCVISDFTVSKAGTITSCEERFMEWKSISGEHPKEGDYDFEVFFRGMFNKDALLQLIKNFLLFSQEGIESYKILSAYHQYFAVQKAVESTLEAISGDHKGGVFWHTQGSGKSLSMVFYAHLLQQYLKSPTIVVITDRNDLDDQLYKQFSKCSKFLRQTPIRATSREHLRSLLEGRSANGIFFTTMQKFTDSLDALSNRNDIIVMCDEAHRSQYGLKENVSKDGEIKIGMARMLRNSLPNATFIGFTGTPISKQDKNTIEVFGDYIDKYDMRQAVADNATKPVYYESRVLSLHLDDETLKLIDHEYDLMAEEASEYALEQSKRDMSQMDAILGHDSTIDSLVKDIIAHYEDNRQDLLTGKAMIVGYSRDIAMKIYHKILELRPDWGNKVKVVMTESNQDPEEWRDIIGNKSHRDELAREFKDTSSEFKIAIVVDMWLTGFDVPSLSTMYVYKPMHGHNLMQAIARVNRVYEDKQGGLIVDYVGIASALKEAMKQYTTDESDDYSDLNIAETAYPEFREQLTICQDIFHGYNFSDFASESDLDRARIISGGVDFIFSKDKDDDREAFLNHGLMLKNALSLCSSLATKEERLKAAFFEVVRVQVLRLLDYGPKAKLSLKEMNRRVNELLKQSIKSDGVINLFSDFDEEFSLFDPKFLDEISRMKEKNLARELLYNLLEGQIKWYQKTNYVKSQKYSEFLRNTMNRYVNGHITNEEVIEELINMAHEIKDSEQEGNELGLDMEELAFYDALTRPQAVRDFYENDELIALTQELADKLRKSRVIDWNKRETARAKMRKDIKRLLRKHGYPPDEEKDAVDVVIAQCEMWADNTDF